MELPSARMARFGLRSLATSDASPQRESSRSTRPAPLGQPPPPASLQGRMEHCGLHELHGRVARITTAGLVDHYELPGMFSQPLGIAFGPDGALWIAENGTAKIAQTALPMASPIVEPASGNGLSQTLTMRLNDPNGASDISVVDVLINDALDGHSACYLAYLPSSNALVASRRCGGRRRTLRRNPDSGWQRRVHAEQPMPSQ